ncbi:MAG TPA: tetrahydromethanopterin S-methyltransferase subunit C [Candidatus Bathyarchaeia archaeon]|nr:tetrahydromethanopterin S-methyltransferase subunit C [Candidatus Bathyarchaeia archaeon]
MTVTPAVVEEEEEAPKKGLSFKFPPEETEMGLIAGIIAAVIVIFTGLPAVIKGVGLLLAFLWGMDSVRKTSKYGLGTGVPSIGVLATGYGVVGALMGLAVAEYGRVGQLYPAVLVGVIIMGIIGYISGIFANGEKFIAMKIPRLERAMMELGMAGTLAILLESSILTGSLSFAAVVDNVMNTGLIALLFIFNCFAMLHPYNACLGPDERRERTRMVAVEISGLICVLLGLAMIGLGTSPYGILDGVSLIVFGVIVWVVFFRMFIKACMDECYATVGTGMIKTIE